MELARTPQTNTSHKIHLAGGVLEPSTPHEFLVDGVRRVCVCEQKKIINLFVTEPNRLNTPLMSPDIRPKEIAPAAVIFTPPPGHQQIGR